MVGGLVNFYRQNPPVVTSTHIKKQNLVSTPKTLYVPPWSLTPRKGDHSPDLK